MRNKAYISAFAQHIRALRDEKDLTLDQVGRISKVGLATIQHIEKGRRNVTISTLLAVAKGLNVHPLDLLNFDHSRFLRNKSR